MLGSSILMSDGIILLKDVISYIKRSIIPLKLLHIIAQLSSVSGVGLFPLSQS